MADGGDSADPEDSYTPAEAHERDDALEEIDSETLPHELPKNNPWKLLLRIGFSVGLVALLVWRLPNTSWGDLVPDPTWAALAWTITAVALLLAAYLLQTLRWYQVSDTLGMTSDYRRLFSHLLTGEFVSKALPTSFGGDIVRVIRQGNDSDDYADAFASVSLERLTGWVVLPLISFIGLALNTWLLQLGTPSTVVLIVNFTTLAALIAILWLAGHPAGAGRLVGQSGWRRYLGAVHLGVVAFRRKSIAVIRVLVTGLGFQFLQCLAVWACARALNLPEVTVGVCLAFFPPAAILQNFPLAIGGLGVREAVFVFLFGAIGVTDAEAIGLGLLVFVVFIISSIAGAPSFFVGGFTGKTATPAAT